MKSKNKGQAQMVSGIIVALVSFIVGITIYFIASPFLRDFIANTRATSGVLTGVVITLIPFVVLLLLAVVFITMWRGGQ